MATAEKGRLLFEAEMQRLAAFLDEFRRREIQPRRDLHTQPGS